VLPPKFLPEKDGIFFVSEIHIEGYVATPRWGRIEADYVNAAPIEPDTHAAHQVAEHIATPVFNACAKPFESGHETLPLALSRRERTELSVGDLPRSGRRRSIQPAGLSESRQTICVRNRTIWVPLTGYG
jgi:hypothetical protein